MLYVIVEASLTMPLSIFSPRQIIGTVRGALLYMVNWGLKSGCHGNILYSGFFICGVAIFTPPGAFWIPV